MSRRVRNRIIMLSVISISIIVIISGIYAVLTHKITIVNSSRYNWRVKFDKLRDARLIGSAKEINKPVINDHDTRISSYSVSLTNPGDSVSYIFDVVNDGDYDAYLGDIHLTKPRCNGLGNNSTNDAKNVCSHLNYTLNYLDGNTVKVGDKLLKKSRKTMILMLAYDSNIRDNELAKNDLIISNLDVELIYTQCEKNSC